MSYSVRTFPWSEKVSNPQWNVSFILNDSFIVERIYEACLKIFNTACSLPFCHQNHNVERAKIGTPIAKLPAVEHFRNIYALFISIQWKSVKAINFVPILHMTTKFAPTSTPARRSWKSLAKTRGWFHTGSRLEEICHKSMLNICHDFFGVTFVLLLLLLSMFKC